MAAPIRVCSAPASPQCAAQGRFCCLPSGLTARRASPVLLRARLRSAAASRNDYPRLTRLGRGQSSLWGAEGLQRRRSARQTGQTPLAPSLNMSTLLSTGTARGRTLASFVDKRSDRAAQARRPVRAPARISAPPPRRRRGPPWPPHGPGARNAGPEDGRKRRKAEKNRASAGREVVVRHRRDRGRALAARGRRRRRAGRHRRQEDVAAAGTPERNRNAPRSRRSSRGRRCQHDR